MLLVENITNQSTNKKVRFKTFKIDLTMDVKGQIIS